MMICGKCWRRNFQYSCGGLENVLGRSQSGANKVCHLLLGLSPLGSGMEEYPQGKSQNFEVKENASEVISLFKSKWPIKQWSKYGFFEENYLKKINIYWLQFPPPSISSHYILGILYIFIMVIGVSGNLLYMVMFIRRKTLRTPSNIFIMNLAISDFFLLMKMPIFIYNSFLLGPALGEIGSGAGITIVHFGYPGKVFVNYRIAWKCYSVFTPRGQLLALLEGTCIFAGGCSIYGFFGGLTGTASIMTLSAIAFDRYKVIVHPLMYKIKQRIYLQIILIWMYSAFFATIPLLDIGFNKYVPEGYLTSCSFDYLSEDSGSRTMIVVFFFAAWVVPVSIIITSYIAIYRIIIRAQRTQLVKARHCREMNARRTEVKAAVIIIVIISLWILAWTPYAVVALLGVTGNKSYITPLSSMIPALFCKIASCLDPYIYALTNYRFRNEFKMAVRGRRSSQWTNNEDRNYDCWAMSEVPTGANRNEDVINEDINDICDFQV